MSELVYRNNTQDWDRLADAVKSHKVLIFHYETEPGNTIEMMFCNGCCVAPQMEHQDSLVVSVFGGGYGEFNLSENVYEPDCEEFYEMNLDDYEAQALSQLLKALTERL